MRYESDFKSNFMNAAGSNDVNLQKDILLDQIASLIKNNPKLVADALINSGFKISDKNSKIEIINSVSKAIYSSPDFQKKIAELIVSSNSNFSNGSGFLDSVKNFFGGSGDAADTVGKAAGVASNINPVNAVANAIGSIFNYSASLENKKSAEAEARASLAAKIFGADDKSKTNLVPIVIIGSVLLIGGLTVFFVLKQK
jgi:hypothetical protein